jgi:hypothetical protein
LCQFSDRFEAVDSFGAIVAGNDFALVTGPEVGQPIVAGGVPASSLSSGILPFRFGKDLRDTESRFAPTSPDHQGSLTGQQRRLVVIPTLECSVSPVIQRPRSGELL